MVPNLLDQVLGGIEGLELGFGLFDADLRLIVCNSQFAKLRSYPDELCRTGTEFEALLRHNAEQGDYEPDVVEAHLAEVKSGDVRTLEQVMPDGIVLAIRTARLGDGSLLLTYQDISELRTAEQSARESNHRHAMVTEAATEGLYDWDVVEDELYVSPQLNRMLGFEDGMLHAEEWVARVHPDDRNIYADATRGHLKGKDEQLSVEYRVRTQSDEYRWFHDSAVAERNDDGRAIRLIGALSDITEQKQAAEALRQSEELHVLALEAVGEWVFDWNAETNNVYYSDGMYSALGLTREQLSTAEDWRRRIHPDDLTGYIDQFSKLARQEIDTLSAEYRFRGSNDEWRWASSHGIAIRDDNSRMLRVVGSTGDVTERKQMTERLEQAQERLIESERLASLGQVTAGVAHEIKNPLNFVNNFAKLSAGLLGELSELIEPLVEKLEEEDREDAEDIVATLRENLAKIEQHGKRADGIVQSMLAHSREGGGESQEIDINKLADEALSLAYHGARAENQEFNVTLVKELDDNAGDITGQQQDLMRVFLNLAGNALYATQKRRNDGAAADYEPTITLRTKDLGERVEIRLRDNGSGMPDDIKDKIFQPFFTTKPTGEGTGLGLSISYDIIAQGHNGRFDVESREGEFTEFCVTLPRSGGANVD